MGSEMCIRDRSKSYSNFRCEDVVKISDLGKFKILELFHGPTLAFKDIAMQLIGNFYQYHLESAEKKINILVATSGDTGAAAIDALKGKSNLNVFVLHPHNKISPVQRRLMTIHEERNVFNIAIEGNFDDCQNLVKAMFNDQNFSNKINMSGVNSINWARIICQIVYYFYAYFQMSSKINFSVPTGNFGDVYAGYLAKKIGLPINKFVVATNQNDIYLDLEDDHSFASFENKISLFSKPLRLVINTSGLLHSNHFVALYSSTRGRGDRVLYSNRYKFRWELLLLKLL